MQQKKRPNDNRRMLSSADSVHGWWALALRVAILICNGDADRRRSRTSFFFTLSLVAGIPQRINATLSRNGLWYLSTSINESHSRIIRFSFSLQKQLVSFQSRLPSIWFPIHVRYLQIPRPLPSFWIEYNRNRCTARQSYLQSLPGLRK